MPCQAVQQKMRQPRKAGRRAHPSFVDVPQISLIPIRNRDCGICRPRQGRDAPCRVPGRCGPGRRREACAGASHSPSPWPSPQREPAGRSPEIRPAFAQGAMACGPVHHSPERGGGRPNAEGNQKLEIRSPKEIRSQLVSYASGLRPVGRQNRAVLLGAGRIW
jgi:hypothetical protein